MYYYIDKVGHIDNIIKKKKILKFIHISKNAGTSIERTGLAKSLQWGIFHSYEYGYWHNYFSLKPIGLRLKYDWFMVVRNPYYRILSEYYCEWGGIGKKNINHNKSEMNEYLIKKIKNRDPKGDHYTEQHKYLDNHKDVHIFILRFEQLNEDFTKLMSFYNIKNINLIKVNTKENKNKKLQFTIEDFSKELIDLINSVYDKDFTLFNYEKINIT